MTEHDEPQGELVFVGEDGKVILPESLKGRTDFLPGEIVYPDGNGNYTDYDGNLIS